MLWSRTAEYASSSSDEARGAETTRGSVMREFMSSFNFVLRARLTFLNRSNSVSTFCGAKRTETCLDFLARGNDDEGATVAVDVAGEVVEVGKGTGSWTESVETGSMWASAEMLGSAAGFEGETAVGVKESEEAGATTNGADKGTVGTTMDAAGRTNTGQV